LEFPSSWKRAFLKVYSINGSERGNLDLQSLLSGFRVIIASNGDS